MTSQTITTILSFSVFTVFLIANLITFVYSKPEQKPTILSSISLLFIGYLLIMYVPNFYPNQKTVEVKGVSERIVKSDSATFNITFTTSGNTIDEANEKLLSQKTKINKFLHYTGIKSKDVVTSPISIVDNSQNSYNNNSSQPRFSLSDTISVSSKDVDLISKISMNTNVLINQDIVFNANTNYYFNNLNSIKSDMIKDSIDNAKNYAVIFANQTNQKVYSVKTINQGLFSISSKDGNTPNDTYSLEKKVRVVTTANYILK